MNNCEPHFGLVGCGHRGIVGFLQSLNAIGKASHVVALCDTNPQRLAVAQETLSMPGCRGYATFDEFLRHPGLDTIIVATPDYSHVGFVVAALAAGKNVVCEKPMATTLADARNMLAARKGQSLRVAFNFRYNAVARRVKELVADGAIGRILRVEACDILGWKHGSDYFRRWHRKQAQSGGLIIHKSTHTFDVVNWWLDDRPAVVGARAARVFYTTDRQKGERCRTCSAAAHCRFHVDLTQDIPGQFAGLDRFYQRMYLEAELYDGYLRDVCVFHKDNDIPDTYDVNVRYAGGALFQYSSIFYAPYEDRTFVLQGDAGRIEVSKRAREIVCYRDNREECREVMTLPEEEGGHGGADLHLVASLFPDRNPGNQSATAEDGYWSLAIGACANESLDQGGNPIAVPEI